MKINICNPQEEQGGTSKENIFIAFGEEGNYLGHGYAYPSINHHQTYETPYLIFIDVTLDDNLDKSVYDEVNQRIFDKVYTRAKELRSFQPELKARIYSGFEYDKDKFDFYIKNGFDEDYSIIMEGKISKGFKFTLPQNVKVKEHKYDCDGEFMGYKEMYDEIFVTPLEKEAFEEQKRQPYYKNLSFAIDGKLVGGCTIFEKDDFGYIETVFVLSESRGKGVSKIIMNYAFDYFISNGLDRTELEVWELNKRAVELYKSFGYREVRKNLMFPGITV